MLVVLLQKGCMMQDILIRLQNQPKINGAHPKDIEDAIKEIADLRHSNVWLRKQLDTWYNKIMCVLRN